MSEPEQTQSQFGHQSRRTVQPWSKRIVKILLQGLLFAIGALWFLYQVSCSTPVADRILERTLGTTHVRTLLAGVGLALALSLMWLRRAQQKSNGTDRAIRKGRLGKPGQFVRLLSSQSLDLQLSAIRSLGSLAEESDEHAQRIAKALRAFIRAHGKTEAAGADSRSGHRQSHVVQSAFEVVAQLVAVERWLDFRRIRLSGIEFHGAFRSKIDFSSADLSRADFSKADLSYTKFGCANLTGADLHGANLNSAELSEANLTGANLGGADVGSADLRSAKLNGANLEKASLLCAKLSYADLCRANLRDVDFYGADISRADLRNADLRGANFLDANVSAADLRGADLRGADLRGADLFDATLAGAVYDDQTILPDGFDPNSREMSWEPLIPATQSNELAVVSDSGETRCMKAEELLKEYRNGIRSFRGAELRCASLHRAQLSGVDLSGADLCHAELRGADLTGTNLSGADLCHAELAGAKLAGAKLAGAKLTGANLSEAILENADLHEADLSDANFWCADLQHAELHHSILCRARFQRANLARSDFTSSDLRSVDLREANLSGADFDNTDLSGADLSHAILCSSKLSDCDLDGAILSGADLGGTFFDNVNLENVDCEGARLGGTRFTFVDLTGFCAAQIYHARPSTFDYATVALSWRAPNLDQFLLDSGIPEAIAKYMMEYARSLDPNERLTLMLSTFLSFGGPDEVFAERLKQALNEHGVRTFFYPSDARLGQRNASVMHREIKAHDRVVLICSEASLTRPGVLNELTKVQDKEAELGGDTCLIPIRLDDYVLSKKFMPQNPDLRDLIVNRVVGDFRGADKDEASLASALPRLVEALRRPTEPRKG